MAYAALLLFKQSLDKILYPHPQIQSLNKKVGYLMDFLEDVSSEKHSLLLGINYLEGKMRDAACEGGDIVELSHLSEPTTSFWEIFYTRLQNLIPVFRQFKHLQKTIEEIDFILESVSKIRTGKVVVGHLEPARSSLNSGSGPSRISSSKRSAMVGLNGDFVKIKEQLTGSSSHLKIIPIVGMGGIGKTTLATNLYNDLFIDYHFDIRAWVTVSQDYHWQQILTDLLSSMRHVNNDEIHQMTIDQLAKNLYQCLKDRRYLLVMDDVWDTKAWDDVKRFFPDDSNGSRVILTTRISEVAIHDGSCNSIHGMSLLGLEESWNLLCEKVFGKRMLST